MTVRQILKLGDPRLERVSEPFPRSSWELLPALLQDLRDTLAEAGGVGIAAPQIGVRYRVILIGSASQNRYPDRPQLPLQALINPELSAIEEPDNEELPFWEGCLSVPGYRGEVWRREQIRCRYLDPKGEEKNERFGGFAARVLQHECDHLDGVLYPQRLKDPDRFDTLSVLTERGFIAP